jgi:hypothetical protein
MKARGETVFAAPKEQAQTCESLRQKDSCLTRLWRAFSLGKKTTKEESRSYSGQTFRFQDRETFLKAFLSFFMPEAT